MLTARNLGKQYPGGHAALAGVALDVRPGEIVALVGASGCGKSTLLRLLAGLERPTTGTVALDGSPIAGPRPEIGLVFQEPRLMPWLTVAQNVGFGLSDRPRAEREALVGAILERVGLQRAADAWPRALSGGMAQRAALARALVAQPSVLLLDEPFSALDPLIRADLQDHLLELWDATRPTLVVVTHDAEEALVLADRIAVMRGPPGRIATVLKPDLPRPRDRSSSALQAWRRRLLAALRPEIELPERGEVLVPAAAI